MAATPKPIRKSVKSKVHQVKKEIMKGTHPKATKKHVEQYGEVLKSGMKARSKKK